MCEFDRHFTLDPPNLTCFVDLKSVNGVLEHQMFLSNTRNLLYVTDLHGPRVNHRLEHLSCFYGGLLALGVETLAGTGDLSKEDAQLHRWAAEGLTNTCSMMYLESPSGLGPEEAGFSNGNANKLWLPEVKKWEKDGKKGSVPPGVRDVTEPIKYGDRDAPPKDYYYANAAYHSRPEVSQCPTMLQDYAARADLVASHYYRPWRACTSCGK